jgi:hypothetical protein
VGERDSPVVVATCFALLATGACLRKHKKANKELFEVFLGSGSIFMKLKVFFFYFMLFNASRTSLKIQVACPERMFQSTR